MSKFKLTDDACLVIYALTWFMAGILVCTVFWTGRQQPRPPSPPWNQHSYADMEVEP